ncbi:hypothetical protein [Erythrobacter sp. WG]|uniref:hypothetical protein n=1 Tax=Erythrobacter sp. WG TaxID=2985510 RepID=UPI00226F3577|nr:hypothetical protein [Erythrobacter sp. WG]MCX9147546.1 hypothetical protein [Erythrobacter sp. WG]
MPYRHAPWFVGALLLVIAAGFGSSYFRAAGPLPLAFHLHAISVIAWLALLIGQHIAVGRRAHVLHSILGRASFGLFPVLIAGFAMGIDIVAGVEPTMPAPGPAAGLGMAAAIPAHLTLFYLALKHRRNIMLHAGYMLAAPLILFVSLCGEVIAQVTPWLTVIGGEGPRDALDMMLATGGLAMLFALGLCAANRKYAAPWLVGAGFIGLQTAVMWAAPKVPALGQAVAAPGSVPSAVTGALGAAAGAAAAWFGWRAGKLSPRALAVRVRAPRAAPPSAPAYPLPVAGRSVRSLPTHRSPRA